MTIGAVLLPVPLILAAAGAGFSGVALTLDGLLRWRDASRLPLATARVEARAVGAVARDERLSEARVRERSAPPLDAVGRSRGVGRRHLLDRPRRRMRAAGHRHRRSFVPSC